MIEEITRIIKNRMSDYAIFDYDKESDTIIITMSDKLVDLMCECISVDLNVAGYRKADKMQVQKAKNECFVSNMKKVLGIEKKNIVKEFARKVKNCSYCDNDFMDGKWHRYVFVDDIDKLLKEYEDEDRRQKDASKTT